MVNPLNYGSDVHYWPPPRTDPSVRSKRSPRGVLFFG